MTQSLGQMLEAAQAYADPMSEAVKAESESKKADYEVNVGKHWQKKKLEELMRAVLSDASSGGGIFKNLGEAGKILGFIPGVGEIASGVTSGLEAWGQAREQKSRLKDILNDPRLKGYETTFLADPTKQFLGDVGKLRDEINPLKTGFAAGAKGYSMAKITGDISEQVGKAFNPDKIAEGQVKDIFAEQGLGETKITDILKGISERSGRGPLQALWQDWKNPFVDNFNMEDFGENLASSQMLLDYLMGGDKGASVELDPSSYMGRRFG